VDFAKPTYPQPMLRQGNRDGVIGATISNAPPPFVTIRKKLDPPNRLVQIPRDLSWFRSLLFSLFLCTEHAILPRSDLPPIEDNRERDPDYGDHKSNGVSDLRRNL
jgi:hypothetical protein